MTTVPQTAANRRSWQARILAITWVTYAGYYLCRKNFGIAIPIWVGSGAYTEFELANCVSAYSVLYAVAQLAIGPLADRLGPKMIVGSGLALVIVSNVLMSFRHQASILLVLACLNGLGQATGWSGQVRCWRWY